MYYLKKKLILGSSIPHFIVYRAGQRANCQPNSRSKVKVYEAQREVLCGSLFLHDAGEGQIL